MVTMTTKTDVKTSKWTINKELLPLKIFNFLMYGVTMTTKTDVKTSKWTINKELLPLKIFNFLMYGACMVIPYITIFLKQLGLSASEIGIIIGCSVFLGLFTRPAIGILADKLGGRKMALVICCMGFSSCFFSLRFIGERDTVNTDIPNLDNGNRNNSRLYDVWICQLGLKSHQGRGSNISTANVGTHKHSNHSNITAGINTYRHQITSCILRQTRRSIGGIEDSDVAILCPSLRQIFQLGRRRRTPTSLACFSLSVKDPISEEFLYFRVGVKDHNKIVFSYDNDNDNNVNDNNSDNNDDNSDNDNDSSGNQNHTQYYSWDRTISPQLLGCFNLDGQSCATKITESIAVQSGNTSAIQLPESFPKLFEAHMNGIKFDSVFVAAFAINVIARSFYASTTSLADAVIYSILGSNRHRWARQRLWGSIGTGVSIIVFTTVSTGFYQTHDLPVLLTVSLCLTFLACVVVTTKLNTSSVKKNSNLLRDIHSVLSNPPFRLHLIKLVLYGYMTGTAQNFFMWFIADIGGSPFNLALTVVVHCISSIIMLRFTGRLLKRLGPRYAMYLVLVGGCLRFLVISFILSPWTVLPIELLHGITYSVLWASASGSTSKMAAPGTQASCHSIAGAVYWDLGRGLGVLATGQIIQEIGARWTFRMYSFVCLAALPLFYCLDWLWPLPQSLSDEVTPEKMDIMIQLETKIEEKEEKQGKELDNGEGDSEDVEKGSVMQNLLNISDDLALSKVQSTNVSQKGM